MTSYDHVIEQISTALSVICNMDLNDDVSTGDVITPSAVKYEFSGIFDESVKITLWGYNMK